MTVVLDTAPVIWWSTDDNKLSSDAAGAIAEANSVLISSVSIWEIGLKARRGQLSIPVPVREFAGRLTRVERVRIQPVDTDTWIRNVDLQWDHQDPADRTIVATAQQSDALLVTSDARILAFYPRAVW